MDPDPTSSTQVTQAQGTVVPPVNDPHTFASITSKVGCTVYFQEMTDALLRSGDTNIEGSDVRPVLLAFRQSLSDAAQHIFVTLLLSNEWEWYRKTQLSDSSLTLEEKAQAIIELTQSLPQLGSLTSFCDGSVKMTFEERLDSLRKPELHEIAAKVGHKVAQRKQKAEVRQAIETALEEARKQPRPPFVKSVKTEIADMATTMLDNQCIRVNSSIYQVFWAAQRAFVTRQLQFSGITVFTTKFIQDMNSWGEVAKKPVAYRMELRGRMNQKAKEKYQAQKAAKAGQT